MYFNCVKFFNFLIEVSRCSHSRVVRLYVESINSNCQFSSVNCASYDLLSQCSCSPVYGCSRMGYYSILNKENGTFYLKTSSKAPFCIS